MSWHSIGEHKKVFEYDGAFECKNCKALWGALTGAKPEPPEHCQAEQTESNSASVPGSTAHIKPVKEYSNEGLVSLALELHSRALTYKNKELHDRAMEARIELIDRLEKGR